MDTVKNVSLICCGALAIYVPQKLYKIYKYYIEKEALRTRITPYMYDVMFFTKKSSLCRYHLNMDTVICKEEECPVKYLRKIKNYLDCATDTLYVCVFVITCPYLREALIAAKTRGITVKIITDLTALGNMDAKIFSYKLENIEVKYLQQCNENGLMHNKFVIVDCRILITGSTNWTMSAFFGNFENLIVTDNPEVVEKYRQHFMNMWNELYIKYDRNSQLVQPRRRVQGLSAMSRVLLAIC